jgi:hypothetical protein
MEARNKLSGTLIRELEENGFAVIHDLIKEQQLVEMQEAFAARLRCMRWNDFDGYEKTERHRHMVQDVLTLHPGFLEAALEPRIKAVLREYLGENFELVEAKGWKSLPTKRNFHGWHADSWYDQQRIPTRIPREVKLGIYLTDVKTGAFTYVRGTHGKQHPKLLNKEESQRISLEQITELAGPAGSAFLFDTSGIHRQNSPILEPRHAVFFAYHDPNLPLQREDVEYYRYHPLTLSAAFLGNLTNEDRRILGFGNLRNFQPRYQRTPRHTVFRKVIDRSYDAKMWIDEIRERARGKLTRITSPASLRRK